MCGIAGMSLDPRATFDPVPLSRRLLTAIESRGKDASGAVWSDDEGTWWDKAPVKGSVYGATRLPMSPLAHTVALHTRFATSGDPKVNTNNHPHSLPGVTGVHNGVIWNDLELFDLVGAEPETECDSEAIFALLAYREELTIVDALSLIEGDASLAWIETADPDRLHLARLTGRPLALARTPKGSMIFASTTALLQDACEAGGVQLAKVWNLPEWTYIAIERGRVVEVEQFTPAKPPRPKPVKRFYGYDRNRASSSSYPGWHGDDAWWQDDVWPQDHVPQGLGLGTPGGSR